MANEEQFNILKQGIAVWNKWREKHFLVKIDLSQVALTGAVLTGANLAAADLRGANLSQTDLREAILSGANLGGCIFWKAVMGNTIFGNSDLSEAIGLEDVVHYAPSRIAADTFALSKGEIPEVFLQGCGLNNRDIECTKLSSPRFMSEPGSSGFAAFYRVKQE